MTYLTEEDTPTHLMVKRSHEIIEEMNSSYDLLYVDHMRDTVGNVERFWLTLKWASRNRPKTPEVRNMAQIKIVIKATLEDGVSIDDVTKALTEGDCGDLDEAIDIQSVKIKTVDEDA